MCDCEREKHTHNSVEGLLLNDGQLVNSRKEKEEKRLRTLVIININFPTTHTQNSEHLLLCQTHFSFVARAKTVGKRV